MVKRVLNVLLAIKMLRCINIRDFDKTKCISVLIKDDKNVTKI